MKDATQPFPVQAGVSAGALRVAIAGTVTDPQNFGELDLRLKLSGDSLSNLYPLTGVTLPDSPPYSTDGRLIAKLHDPAGATFQLQVTSTARSATAIFMATWASSPASLAPSSAARWCPINC